MPTDKNPQQGNADFHLPVICFVDHDREDFDLNLAKSKLNSTSKRNYDIYQNKT